MILLSNITLQKTAIHFLVMKATTYKAESSTHFAKKNLKLKRYELTFRELSRYEEKHEIYFYDDDSTLDEQL